MAHVDAGKTTTTERMLYYAGYTQRIGNVDEGSTVTDYLKAEKERGITITSACIPFAWNQHRINLIDTPGHIDFTMEVERAIRVLEGAVCLLDGVAGVEAQTENVWRQANRYKVPRIAMVNKMDREGSSLLKTLESMRERLRGWGQPLLCQWPVLSDGGPSTIRTGAGGMSLIGIVDLLSMQVLDWSKDRKSGTVITKMPLKDYCIAQSLTQESSDLLLEQVSLHRTHLVEVLSELDEEIIELFLSYEADHLKVPEQSLKKSLSKLTQEGKVVPVFCGAAFRNMGVQPILDAVVDFLPSPKNRPPALALNQKSGKEQLVKGSDKDLCALAFKVIHDERRGPLVFVRVYSGTFYFILIIQSPPKSIHSLILLTR
jgi:elongation factor G